MSAKTDKPFPGIGPKSGEMLRAAGITSLSQLREIGSVRAFVMVKRVAEREPGLNFKPSLNFLWGLEGLLAGERWQDVARLRRTSLLMALEEVERHMLQVTESKP